MKEPVVTDSTCLIGLERIGRLDILPALFDPLLMPPEVAREFGSTLSWLQTEPLTSNLLVAVLRLLVDAGEAEAIALASEKGCREEGASEESCCEEGASEESCCEEGAGKKGREKGG